MGATLIFDIELLKIDEVEPITIDEGEPFEHLFKPLLFIPIGYLFI